MKKDEGVLEIYIPSEDGPIEGLTVNGESVVSTGGSLIVMYVPGDEGANTKSVALGPLDKMLYSLSGLFHAHPGLYDMLEPAIVAYKQGKVQKEGRA